MRKKDDLNAVDRSGAPFPERYVSVIREIRTHLWRRYPEIVDATDREEAIEQTLRRANDHEQKNGEAVNLPALIWRIFPEVVQNILRKHRYKLLLTSIDKSKLQDIPDALNQRQQIETRLYADELLSSVDERTRRILHLRFVLEMDAPKIATVMGISASNVYVIIHRALHRLKERR